MQNSISSVMKLKLEIKRKLNLINEKQIKISCFYHNLGKSDLILSIFFLIDIKY